MVHIQRSDARLYQSRRNALYVNNAFSYNAMLETVTGTENIEDIEGDPFVGTPFETNAIV